MGTTAASTAVASPKPAAIEGIVETWRGHRFVGSYEAGVAAGVDAGLNYGYPGYGYSNYSGYAYGYGDGRRMPR